MFVLLDVRVRRRSLVSSEPCLPINSALCCLRSLWKIKSVYHGDWHCVASPFSSLTHAHTRHLHTSPPPATSATLHDSDTQLHTDSYVHPAGTDSVAEAASACSLPILRGVSLPYQCNCVCQAAALSAGGGKPAGLCVGAMRTLGGNYCIV